MCANNKTSWSLVLFKVIFLALIGFKLCLCYVFTYALGKIIIVSWCHWYNREEYRWDRAVLSLIKEQHELELCVFLVPCCRYRNIDTSQTSQMQILDQTINKTLLNSFISPGKTDDSLINVDITVPLIPISYTFLCQLIVDWYSGIYR